MVSCLTVEIISNYRPEGMRDVMLDGAVECISLIYNYFIKQDIPTLRRMIDDTSKDKQMIAGSALI